jgi:hypothetical protein
MARMQKRVSAGIYQPTCQRRAYGRYATSAALVEDAKGAAVTAQFAPWWLPRRAVPMPCGGARKLLHCPRCRRWAVQLYTVDWLRPHAIGLGYACRVCLGLRYTSQYAGRRPEAAFDWMARLAEAARGVKSTLTCTHREQRYQAVRATVRRRRERFDARCSTAERLSLTILLVREVSRENRRWARRILPAVLRADVATRREVAEHPDTPAWARTAILGSLASVLASGAEADAHQTGMPASLDAAPDPAQHAPLQRDAPRLAALLSQERIDDLKAMYIALGAGRRHRKAA